MAQLPLDIALPPRLGRDDFLRADANAEALDALERWPAWPHPVAVLLGPPGSGKSHLAAIWAERAGAARWSPPAFAEAGWPSRLGSALLVEDLDRARPPDAALFHLLNLAGERGVGVLLTAAAAPERWGVTTPDLASRLRAPPRLVLRAPDDDLLRLVLVKLFADRQIIVEESVVAYLVLHLARSLGQARAVVDALDREALALGKRVTRPMASRVLARLDPE